MKILTNIALLIALPLAASANFGVEMVGRLYNYWNYATSVAVSGDFAFVTTDYSGLQVVDISDPENPAIIAVYSLDDSSYCSQIVIRDNFAFVAWDDLGLKIFDVSDPYQPVIHDYTDTVGCWNLKLDGSFLYASGGRTYRILDVSDPTHPELIWHLYDDFGMSWLYSPAFRDSLMFFLVMNDAGEGGIGALDFSDPDDPEWLWGLWLPLSWGPSSLALSGDRAYVAAGDSGIFVVDITHPEGMQHVATIPFDTTLYELCVRDTLAIANFGDSIKIFDMDADTVWTRSGSVPLEVPLENMAVSDGRVYGTTATGGFQAFDIADPTQPTAITRFENHALINDVEIVGSSAFLVGNNVGFRTVDISDPANPVEIGRLGSDGFLKYLTVVDTLAFVSDVSQGIRVIDISEPARPTEIAFIETPPHVERLFLADTLLYVALDHDGLSVYDISNLQNPVLLGNFDPDGRTVRDVAVQNGYAYLACDQYDLYVVEVTHPENMIEVDYLSTHGYAERLRLNNEILYLADGRGLTIFSIAEAEHPVELGFCPLTGFTRDVEVRGAHALVADYHGGFKVIDVSDPVNPTLAGSYQTPGNAIGVAALGDNHALVADMTNLSVYDYSGALASRSDLILHPSSFSLSAFPNPFNSSTTITFSGGIPPSIEGGRGGLSLCIYDLSGRLVADLTHSAFRNPQSAFGRVVWDAGDYPAGVYLVKLENAGKSIVQKSVIIR